MVTLVHLAELSPAMHRMLGGLLLGLLILTAILLARRWLRWRN